MPFVKRDDNGKIVALYSAAEMPGLEEVSTDDPGLIDFLYDGDEDAAAKKDMVDSDLGLARVLEDLIDLLGIALDERDVAEILYDLDACAQLVLKELERPLNRLG